MTGFLSQRRLTRDAVRDSRFGVMAQSMRSQGSAKSNVGVGTTREDLSRYHEGGESEYYGFFRMLAMISQVSFMSRSVVVIEMSRPIEATQCQYVGSESSSPLLVIL